MFHGAQQTDEWDEEKEDAASDDAADDFDLIHDRRRLTVTGYGYQQKAHEDVAYI